MSDVTGAQTRSGRFSRAAQCPESDETSGAVRVAESESQSAQQTNGRPVDSSQSATRVQCISAGCGKWHSGMYVVRGREVASVRCAACFEKLLDVRWGPVVRAFEAGGQT